MALLTTELKLLPSVSNPLALERETPHPATAEGQTLAAWGVFQPAESGVEDQLKTETPNAKEPPRRELNTLTC